MPQVRDRVDTVLFDVRTGRILLAVHQVDRRRARVDLLQLGFGGHPRENAVGEFVEAARNAREAGFDGVEIAANGTHLIAQSLNPRLTGPNRLGIQIVDAVTEVWDQVGGTSHDTIEPYLPERGPGLTNLPPAEPFWVWISDTVWALGNSRPYSIAVGMFPPSFGGPSVPTGFHEHHRQPHYPPNHSRTPETPPRARATMSAIRA
ncbi:hypothetical protein ACFQ1S_31625 [Kibdelosporangium lantanae]|uniref:NADH:flavin oxidoreductase/NADH oxidase N-terminal domain-containing protein n=1 Tax=Kibdelosporangium lantanae TaxID=1497396 RepID=A0ABW3MGM2_9PSEU